MNNNILTVVGHVGQAPTSVTFGDTGNKVVKFSIAIKEYSANTDEDKTLWLDVNAWNGLAERVLSTFTVGREVVLTGRLALSEFERDINGVKVKTQKPFLKLSDFTLCGKKPTDVVETPPQEKPTKSRKLAVASA